MPAAAVWPVLGHHAAHRIPTFIVLHFGKVIAAREQIQSGDRIVISALRHQVVVVLHDNACSEIEHQSVFSKLSRVARSEVVPVVFAFRDYACRIGGRGGDISLVLRRTGRERHRVDYVRTGIEELARVIAVSGRKGVAPAVHASALAIAVLHFGHHVHHRKSGAVADRYRSLALRASLGIDDYDTVGRIRAVKGCRRRASKH